MEIVSIILGSSVITSIIVTVLNRIFQKSDKKDAQRHAVLFILRCQITQLAKEYIKDGTITTEELQEISLAYETYKNLGGNGFIENVMNKVNNLTIVEE